MVTSLDAHILPLAQLYRDRADCDNHFDELKNQWGRGGYTTHDLKRCRLIIRMVALIYNLWSLFVRLAPPIPIWRRSVHAHSYYTLWPSRPNMPASDT